MESDVAPPPSAVPDDGGVDTNAAETKQPTPITNVILSQAVTTAISQLDTKRAFDMMLLNEQMTAMEAESKCLKEESSFLRESLAKQSQETSEMYHYFHGKMDAHVATIGGLENDLAAARAEIERLHEQHAVELLNVDATFQSELSKAQNEISNLRDELYQVRVFSTQKKQMEELVCELEEQLKAKTKQFADEKNALELKAMFEKDRVKKEMLLHMKDTKEALLLRTDEQLNTTTKRTMMENDHFMEELSFQSKETEKLLMRFRQVEEEVQRLRVANKVLEENELVMAKKNHYYQKILGQLKKQGKDAEKQPTAELVDDEAVATLVDRDKELQTTKDELERLQTKAVGLEASLKLAHQWVHAFQQEKQFVIAQQDEIIQFLCRVLSDATGELSRKQLPKRPGDGTMAEAAKATATMEDLVTRTPPISLDELSSDETRYVLVFLLEKMKLYQDRVAMIYRGQKVSQADPKAPDGNHRDLLAKQLGVELPPIVQPSVPITSPLKVKRRIQPYTLATATATATRPAPTNSLNQDVLCAPLQAKLKASTTDAMLPPNRLLTMATSHFNFLQPTPSPVKKPSTQKLTSPLSPTKHAPRTVVARREREPDSSCDGLEDEASLVASSEQPSAWSTDSLPPCDGQDLAIDSPPSTTASRRKP